MVLKIIGVTGGIGSGKSTVARTLADLGAAIVDADVLAKGITSKGGKAFVELVEYFGDEIVDSDGELDRARLASIAFGDRNRLNALNSITHKYITEKIRDTVALLEKSGKWDIVVIDAPIPLEKGFLDLVDEVWVVVADREARVRRVMERSGLSLAEVSDRINSQPGDDEYISMSDELLYNNDSVDELEQAAVRLFLQKKQEWQRVGG